LQEKLFALAINQFVKIRGKKQFVIIRAMRGKKKKEIVIIPSFTDLQTL